jgi:outer membrane protein assembly factor BamB
MIGVWRCRKAAARSGGTLLVSIVWLVLVTGPASAGGGDWPMYADGPAHNGVNRAETVLTPANAGDLRVLASHGGWRVLPAFPYQIVVGSRSYGVSEGLSGGANTYITAFNLPSGTVAWRRKISTNGCTWHYVPAVGNGILFVGGGSAMYAFNAATGARLWVRWVPACSAFNSVTVKGNDVYASTYYGQRIYDFDAGTGAVRWVRHPVEPYVQGPVSVSGGLAYTLDDALYAYDADSGALVFKVGTGYFSGTPVVSGGLVYIQTPNSLVARDASDGSSMWSVPLDSYGGYLTPVVDGDTVVAATARYLRAFDAISGAARWTTDGGQSASYGTPALANGVVYAGSFENGLQAVDEATGRVLYSSRTDSLWSCDNPVVSQGGVYVPCDLGGWAHQMSVFGL